MLYIAREREAGGGVMKVGGGAKRDKRMTDGAKHPV